ncbi:MAG: ion transporter [Gammaproteobacteria bacterium]|nr:ion transporter [Gammaproteobacteria bacterium]
MKSIQRSRLQTLVEHLYVQRLIITLIVINAILLGLETSSLVMDEFGGIIQFMDRTILGVFVVEILLRLFVYRMSFWRDPWSLFDFSVVAIALIPASGPFAILRALRVLRVLRLMTMVPSMRRVVGALLAAIPGLGSIAVMLMIFYYVFAVIATNMFASTYPEWFGTLGSSFYTLFQIMTLESWSMGIVRPVMETFPYAWMFFIPFIMVATFTMLNLFIAIIVNAMQSYSAEEHKDTVVALHQTEERIDAELHAQMQSLQAEMREIKLLLLFNARKR